LLSNAWSEKNQQGPHRLSPSAALLAQLQETYSSKTTEDFRTQNQPPTIVPEELSQIFAD
jgi:hypothetical protein